MRVTPCPHWDITIALLPCRALKQGKLDRTEQLEAFINYKEAARAIAEKMSGGKIDWVEEEARARSTIKRSIVRMGEQSP